MNNSKNFVSLDIDRVKEIIKDRVKLKSEPHNCGICTNYKNTINVFNDRLAALKTNDFYALVPQGYAKNESGKWVYDMSNFKIYCVTKDYIESLDIEIDYNNYSDVTQIKLSDDILSYCSVEGKKVENKDVSFTSLTAREFACLYLMLPKSGNVWLDALIRESINKDSI